MPKERTFDPLTTEECFSIPALLASAGARAVCGEIAEPVVAVESTWRQSVQLLTTLWTADKAYLEGDQSHEIRTLL